MLKRLSKFLVAKFTIKLLNSVDIYKTINNNQETINHKVNEINKIHEILDQKIHNIQLRLNHIQLSLNHFPQDILKLFFNELSLNPDAIAYSEKLRSILTLHRPLNKRFIRKGDNKDGGYVIVDDLTISDTLFSIGIGDNITFDIDCENQVSRIVLVDDSVPHFEIPNSNYYLHRKKLGAYEDNLHITIDKLLNTYQSKDYILKIDIEGNEWEILSSVQSATITKFRQIIIEFHALFDMAQSELILKALNNLLKTHLPVVIHPNNIGGYCVIGSSIFPNVFETTWLRRDSYDLAEGIDSEVLTLEKINDPEKSSVWVNWIYRPSFMPYD
jgi:hypothetical protein